MREFCRKSKIHRLLFVPHRRRNGDFMNNRDSLLYKEFSFPIGDFNIVFFSDSGFATRGKYSSDTHQHDFNEILCISEGSASLFVGDEVYSLCAGDAVLIPEGTIHSFKTESNAYFTAISFWQDTGGEHHSPIYSLTEKKELRIFRSFKAASAFERILDYYYGTYVYKNELISACLCEIIVMMLEESDEKESISQNVITLESNTYRSYLINQYFSENFNHSPSLEALADILHLSTQQTGRIIKRIYARSFREHVIHLRINHAKHLLTNTDTQINEIASLLGYALPHTFFDIFKSETGMTPLQYRKNNS